MLAGDDERGRDQLASEAVGIVFLEALNDGLRTNDQGEQQQGAANRDENPPGAGGSPRRIAMSKGTISNSAVQMTVPPREALAITEAYNDAAMVE